MIHDRKNLKNYVTLLKYFCESPSLSLLNEDNDIDNYIIMWICGVIRNKSYTLYKEYHIVPGTNQVLDKHGYYYY